MDEARAYIERGPPFTGSSDFSAKHALKRAGARWNHGAKKWQANDVAALDAMMQTGLWLPDGLHPRSALHIPALAAELERVAEQEALAAGKQAERERNARILRDAGILRAQQAERARRELGVPPNEPSFMQTARENGVSPELVAESASWGFLGPRGGISDARRLCRGVRLGVLRWSDVTSGAARARNT